MGRTIIEITPFTPRKITTPQGATSTPPTERILLPPSPMSLNVGLNISYLSISLVEQPREILFGVFADVRARVQRTTEFEAYSFSILNFQFDNQSERKPPYEGCLFAIRPDNDHAAVQGFLQRRVIPGRAVACFTAVRLDLMPIALRLSDVLLFHLREFAAGISAGPKAEESSECAYCLSHIPQGGLVSVVAPNNAVGSIKQQPYSSNASNTTNSKTQLYLNTTSATTPTIRHNCHTQLVYYFRNTFVKPHAPIRTPTIRFYQLLYELPFHVPNWFVRLNLTVFPHTVVNC